MAPTPCPQAGGGSAGAQARRSPPFPALCIPPRSWGGSPRAGLQPAEEHGDPKFAGGGKRDPKNGWTGNRGAGGTRLGSRGGVTVLGTRPTSCARASGGRVPLSASTSPGPRLLLRRGGRSATGTPAPPHSPQPPPRARTSCCPLPLLDSQGRSPRLSRAPPASSTRPSAPVAPRLPCLLRPAPKGLRLAAGQVQGSLLHPSHGTVPGLGLGQRPNSHKLGRLPTTEALERPGGGRAEPCSPCCRRDLSSACLLPPFPPAPGCCRLRGAQCSQPRLLPLGNRFPQPLPEPSRSWEGAGSEGRLGGGRGWRKESP